jgi:lipopolysaccharide transport system permease protein
VQIHQISARHLFRSIWSNRHLILTSIKREVLGRYKGSVLGIFWSLVNPLLMLTLYTFIFSEVFKAKWSGGSDSKTEFALVLFIGLIVFTVFTESVNRAPSLIISNVNYVKKVVFPLETLPVVVLGAAIFHASISLTIWLIAYVFVFGLPHLTVMYLPVVLLPFLLMTLGFCWFLASVGTYLRDVSQFMVMLTSVLMFISPIFFSINSFPEKYRFLLFFNPLTPAIEICRDVLFWGKPPNFHHLTMYLFAGSLIAWLGFAWFQITRKGFADVL